MESDAQGGIDYFFPVRVLKAAPGSDTSHLRRKTSYFIPLRNLSFQRNALAVTAPTALYLPDDGIETTPLPVRRSSGPVGTDTRSYHSAHQLSQSRTLEASGGCSNGRCTDTQMSQPSHTESGIFGRLKDYLSSSISGANQRAQRTAARTLYDTHNLAERFQSSCGFSLNSFIPEVARQSRSSGVPSDILLSLMTQESSGRCHIRQREANRSMSVGLFQVSARNSRFKLCTPSQIKTIRRLHPTQLTQGPQCLDNPVINLSEAIRILKSKASFLTQSTIRFRRSEIYSGFEPNRFMDASGRWNRDLWRLAVSAYNGGERWVLRAKYDLETFNARHGQRLNAYNWEDLRVFYLRNHLSQYRNGHSYFFGNSMTGRKERNALLNLAYTENVVPRKSISRYDQNMTIGDYWSQYLHTRN
jgi:hypothetical protein